MTLYLIGLNLCCRTLQPLDMKHVNYQEWHVTKRATITWVKLPRFIGDNFISWEH